MNVLDTIRKLAALAGDTAAAPGEVEAALGRMAALAAKHSLSDADIRRACATMNGTAEAPHWTAADCAETVLWQGGRMNRHASWIARACAKAAGCGYYLSRGAQARVVAYGLPADLAVVDALFYYAWREKERCTKAYARDVLAQRRAEAVVSSATVDRQSFRDGFCVGLIEAAERAAEESASSTEKRTVAAAQGPGTALVVTVGQLVAARKNAVEAYHRQLGLRRGRRAFRRVRGGDAHAAGRAAGSRVSLSRRVIR